MDRIAEMLLPWEVSPLTIAVCGGIALLYLIGLRRGSSPGPWRIAGFFTGVALMYVVMQTRFDYYAQYLFFAHRGQHVVLHHLAPFLIALSAPGAVLAAALPKRLHPIPADAAAGRWVRQAARDVYRTLQNPWVAGVLFVGLIVFWLIPAVHFDAMLSRRLYWVMNWSMALDGLLFWWLVFARDPDGVTPHLALGSRLLLLLLIIPPQMLLGAGITLSQRPLFDVYDVCGRALTITPMADQQMGGLITWLPAVMMSMAGVLILLSQQLNQGSKQGEVRPC